MRRRERLAGYYLKHSVSGPVVATLVAFGLSLIVGLWGISSTIDRNSRARTQQINDLTAQVQELRGQLVTAQEQAQADRVAYGARSAIDAQTIAQLAAEVIRRGGDPAPILAEAARRQAAVPRSTSPSPRQSASPSTSPASPSPSPSAVPRPSAQPSATDPGLLCRLLPLFC